MAPTLLDMPDNCMRAILERCDLAGIQSLRKTCHALRNFIDDSKLDPKISTIYVQYEPDIVSMTIYFWDFQKEDLTLNYHNHQDGCRIVWERSEGEKEKLLSEQNTDFVDIFCRDFGVLTKNLKISIDYFHIQIYGPDDIGFSRKFKKVLKISNFKSEKLHLRVQKSTQILSILPFFDSKVLKKLEIVDSRRTDVTLELEEIVELEQWKRLEDVEIQCFSVKKPERFKHLSKAIASFMTVTAEGMQILKQTFLASPNFAYCKLKFIYIEPDVFHALGPHGIMDGDRIDGGRRWFFNMQDFENVLCVEINSSYLNFSKVKWEDVPLNAAVQ